MAITCCYQCEKRHPHCHATCEDYISAKAEHLKEQSEKTRQRAIESGMWVFRRKAIIKMLKTKQDHRNRKRK